MDDWMGGWMDEWALGARYSALGTGHLVLDDEPSTTNREPNNYQPSTDNDLSM